MNFPHRQATSHSKLTYLWESLIFLNIHLMIANQWTPKLQFNQDIVILDVIINTQQEHAGLSTFISKQRIVHANACRLWLQVTLLSDITMADNKRINPAYFHGEHQGPTTIEYPYQPKPPPVAWQAWRSLLRQCFVTHCTDSHTELILYQSLGPKSSPDNPPSWQVSTTNILESSYTLAASSLSPIMARWQWDSFVFWIESQSFTHMHISWWVCITRKRRSRLYPSNHQ